MPGRLWGCVGVKMCRCGDVHVMKTWVEMSRCGDVHVGMKTWVETPK